MDNAAGYNALCQHSGYVPASRVSASVVHLIHPVAVTVRCGVLFVAVDLSVEHLAPAPAEDLIFEANVVDRGEKLVVVDGMCWNADRTEQYATGRVVFNIYKNPQPFLYKLFELSVTWFGGPGILGVLNPVTFMK